MAGDDYGDQGFAVRDLSGEVRVGALPPTDWLLREPEDTADAFPHNTVDMLRRPDSLLVGASVRGRAHAHGGRWREDAFAIGFAGEWLLASVADGAGSRPLARVGANIASQAATATLRQIVSSIENDYAPEETLRRYLTHALRGARHALEAEAKSRQCQLHDLATTLLIVALKRSAEGDLFGWCGLGDGLIALKTSTHIAGVVQACDRGEYAGETQFITTRDFDELLPHRARSHRFPRSITAVLLATDGVADDFFPPDRRTVELFDGEAIGWLTDEDGNPLNGVLTGLAKTPMAATDCLLRWLRYRARGSDDDRTVVLLLTELTDGDRPPR